MKDSIGIEAIYLSKHSVSLQYNGYHWRTGDTGSFGFGPAYAGFGGNGPVGVNDRDWLQLQFKTSF